MVSTTVALLKKRSVPRKPTDRKSPLASHPKTLMPREQVSRPTGHNSRKLAALLATSRAATEAVTVAFIMLGAAAQVTEAATAPTEQVDLTVRVVATPKADLSLRAANTQTEVSIEYMFG